MWFPAIFGRIAVAVSYVLHDIAGLLMLGTFIVHLYEGTAAQINVNDDVNFKLGVLGQFQADWLGDPASDDTAQNLFIRRIRLLFGGQVAKNVTFFVETDAPNLGKVLPGGTNISPAVNLQDAYAEFKLHSALAIDAGLMFVPFSRNSLQSAPRCYRSITMPTRSRRRDRRSQPSAATPDSK